MRIRPKYITTLLVAGAAAAGGVTTVVDMPLNSVPATTTVDGLRAKIAAAIGRCSVDVGLWGGLVSGVVTAA